MWFIAQIEGLDALIKAWYRILMFPQKFSFCFIREFLRNYTWDDTQSRIFQKNFNWFQQTKSQVKVYRFIFLYGEKNSFFKLRNFHNFFYVSFFQFCFLPTNMFHFNVWGLKRKFMTHFIRFNQNNLKKNKRWQNWKALGGKEEPMPSFS